jgi:hypothetical protein
MTDSLSISVCNEDDILTISNSELSKSDLTISDSHANSLRDEIATTTSTTTISSLASKEIFPFFALPREIRDMIYTALLCISHPSDTLPIVTDITKVRHCIGITIPPAQILCRQFEEELCEMHIAAHTNQTALGPRFPRKIGLVLAVENPLAWISVYEKLAWDEEVAFVGIPSRYLETVETLSLECRLDPKVHEDERYEEVRKEELLDEWMISLVDWLWDVLADSVALKELKLRFTVGHVEELEILKRRLEGFMEWPLLETVEMAWEWRHGTKIWEQCDRSWEFLREVSATRGQEGWCVERRFE